MTLLIHPRMPVYSGLAPLADRHGRHLTSLRLSVIDRCDLRCRYCMPEKDYTWLPRQQLLSVDQFAALVAAFAALGVSRLRLTGGEPLLRDDLPALVQQLSAIPGIGDLAMTTNGTRLAAGAAALRDAGLRRVTVSLDSLHRDRFRQLTRSDRLEQVVHGLETASAAGFQSVKINTVVIRDFNDDELVQMLEFARQLGAELRFIEYMDVGGATRWTRRQVVSRRQILARLRQHYGRILPEPRKDTAPADRFRLPDGTLFGVIASVTEPFCGQCDRSRLTADGLWYLCLYAKEGLNLQRLLSEGGPEAVMETVARTWRERLQRGAEERLQHPERGSLFQIQELKRDPHREMHTRGG